MEKNKALYAKYRMAEDEEESGKTEQGIKTALDVIESDESGTISTNVIGVLVDGLADLYEFYLLGVLMEILESYFLKKDFSGVSHRAMYDTDLASKQCHNELLFMKSAYSMAVNFENFLPLSYFVMVYGSFTDNDAAAVLDELYDDDVLKQIKRFQKEYSLD